jgi:hypothetical protein
VGRGQNRELALEQGQELVLELVREQVWAVLTRIIRNKELLLADRQEEICRLA